MLLLWLKFIIATLIIVFSGVRLSHYGDSIAQRTGLTRAWIGIILLAAITSLPELVTSMGAALMVKAPDLALGDLLGSNAFNIMALGSLLIIYRQRKPTSKIVAGVICSLFGIILVGLVGGGIIFHSPFSLGWFGLDSLLILVIYLLSIRLIYRYEHPNKTPRPRSPMESGGEQNSKPQTPNSELWTQDRSPITPPHPPQRGETSPVAGDHRSLITKFIIAALFIVGAGIWLAHLGGEIASETHWGMTFVGSLFLAVITSFPEVVVARTALKMGALDMAVGTILGSNTFNLALIPLIDIFYRSGPLLGQVSSPNPNLLAAGMVAVLTIIILGGLLYRSRKRVPRFSPDSLFIIAIYLMGMYYLFKLK